MANYGVKISKPGYGVGDGDRRLIYNSSYPLLKKFYSVSSSVTLTSGSYDADIYTHNLNYKPQFWLNGYYVNINTGSLVSRYRKYSFREYYGVQVWSKYWAYATTTTIHLTISTAYSGNETINYKLIVFYDGIS